MDTDKIFAEKLAGEYAPKDTSKIIQLKKLDRKAKRPAEIFSYTFGTIMSLIFGLGLCLCMKVIGSGSAAMMVLGVITGVVGFAGIGLNYPVYRKLLEKGKQKYAFEIVELAKQITEE